MVGILHTGVVSLDWARALRDLQLPAGTAFTFSSHWPYDVSRNKICEAALDHHCEWLLFLDSDVVPPPDAVIRLMAHNLPIVQGLYFSKVGQHFPLVMRRTPQPGPDGKMQNVFAALEFPQGSMVAVDTVATGLLLLHRRVLKAFKDAGVPWFTWTMGRKTARAQLDVSEQELDLLGIHVRFADSRAKKALDKVVRGLRDEPTEEGLSEDFMFGVKAKAMGFPLFVDTSVRADHVTQARIRGMGMLVPMETP